jgi:PKD repeat protein
MGWRVGVLASACAAGAGAAGAQADGASLSADPALGVAPLAVTFTGGSGGAVFFGGIEIDFGDGQRAPFCGPGRACSGVKIVHTYAMQGSYTARLLGAGEGKGGPLALATVTISAS